MIKLHGFPISAPNDKVICSSSSGDRKAPWRASGVCSIVSILIQEGQRTGAGLNRYLSSYIWETQQGSKGGRAGNKAPVNPETPWTFEQIWWPRGLAPEDSRNLWHGESEKLPVTWGCFWGSADDAAGDGFVVCVRWVWGETRYPKFPLLFRTRSTEHDSHHSHHEDMFSVCQKLDYST